MKTPLPIPLKIDVPAALRWGILHLHEISIRGLLGDPGAREITNLYLQVLDASRESENQIENAKRLAAVIDEFRRARLN